MSEGAWAGTRSGVSGRHSRGPCRPRSAQPPVAGRRGLTPHARTHPLLHLCRLISPVDTATFWEGVHEDAPLLVARPANRAYFEGLFSKDGELRTGCWGWLVRVPVFCGGAPTLFSKGGERLPGWAARWLLGCRVGCACACTCLDGAAPQGCATAAALSGWLLAPTPPRVTPPPNPRDGEAAAPAGRAAVCGESRAGRVQAGLAPAGAARLDLPLGAHSRRLVGRSLTAVVVPRRPPRPGSTMSM